MVLKFYRNSITGAIVGGPFRIKVSGFSRSRRIFLVQKDPVNMSKHASLPYIHRRSARYLSVITYMVTMAEKEKLRGWEGILI